MTFPSFFLCHLPFGTAVHHPSLWLALLNATQTSSSFSSLKLEWVQGYLYSDMSTLKQALLDEYGEWQFLCFYSAGSIPGCWLKHCPSRISSRIMSPVLGAGSQRSLHHPLHRTFFFFPTEALCNITVSCVRNALSNNIIVLLCSHWITDIPFSELCERVLSVMKIITLV